MQPLHAKRPSPARRAGGSTASTSPAPRIVPNAARAAVPSRWTTRWPDASFDRVIGGSDVPVLVDFYADWCGPCKIMAPVLDAVAQARAGGVLVAKLDTDRNPAVARRFQIASIPTLIVFRGGREVGRELGAIPRPRLEALIDGAMR